MAESDELREAARLLRERAGKATPAPWRVGSRTCELRGNDGRNYVGSTYGGLLGYEEANAQHIAAIADPAVAIALADWLHTAGADLWAHGPLCECGTGCDACDDNLWEPHVRDALAFARAYLKTSPAPLSPSAATSETRGGGQ